MLLRKQGGISAGIFGAANRLNPLYGLGCTGADVYNAVAEGDDEKLGRAVEKIAVAAVGVAVAGRLARGPGAARGAGASGNFVRPLAAADLGLAENAIVEGRFGVRGGKATAYVNYLGAPKGGLGLGLARIRGSLAEMARAEGAS